MFRPNPAYRADGYKTAHAFMIQPGTTRLYGTWIPRSLKHAPKWVKKIMSACYQITAKELLDEWTENFFQAPVEDAVQFAKDMSAYLMLPYNGDHFKALHELQYLPIRIKAMPEGLETNPNVVHATFVNTHDDFAWLTLYIETQFSCMAYHGPTAASIAAAYKRNTLKYVKETDEKNLWFADYMNHDFSTRGLDPWTSAAVSLGHAISNVGSDALIAIPASRYYYGEDRNTVIVASVPASEHSVSTTKIFTVGEEQMLLDWMEKFPKGILSVVSDTFDLWKLITEYLPNIKEQILARDGKIVIRPDSGNPADILCGINPEFGYKGSVFVPQNKGVIELLWDIFGGTVNDQGFKVLDPHIGAIYGDSITLDRQVEIYERLKAKGFAATNVILGVGSYTYRFTTRDTFGFAAKGSWFLCNGVAYDIWKDPVTDDGGKVSLKGLMMNYYDESGEIVTKQQCTWEEEAGGLLQVILEDSKLYNQTKFTPIREMVKTRMMAELEVA